MKKIIFNVLLKVLFPILAYPIIGIGLLYVVIKCFPNITTTFSVSISDGAMTIKDDFNQIVPLKNQQSTQFNRIKIEANKILPDLYLDQSFTQFEQKRIAQAYNVLAKVIQDPQLETCINTNTTSVIHFKTLTKPLGELIIQPLLQSNGNMYITKYISDGNSGGNAQINIISSTHDSFRINIKTKYSFSPSETDILELVEIIFHESAHNAGFNHKGRIYSQDTIKQFRGNGVYVSGWCASNIAQKYL
jgi:hypothetical protein